MADDHDRTPFSALRAWLAPRDDAARERARALLEAHIASARRGRAARARRAGARRRWAAPAVALLLAGGAAGAVAAVLLRTAHTGHLPVFTAQGTLSPQFHVGERGERLLLHRLARRGRRGRRLSLHRRQRDQRPLLRRDARTRAPSPASLTPGTRSRCCA